MREKFELKSAEFRLKLPFKPEGKKKLPSGKPDGSYL